MERESNDTKRAYGNRAWYKCSACRSKKIKVSKEWAPQDLPCATIDEFQRQCTPWDRVWNGEMEQKCEYCGSRNLPCGPNFKRDEDPEVFKRRAEYRHALEPDNATGSTYDTSSTTSPSEFSGSLTMGHGYQRLSSSNNKLDRDNTGGMSIIVDEAREVGDEREGKDGLKAYSDEKLKVEALAK